VFQTHDAERLDTRLQDDRAMMMNPVQIRNADTPRCRPSPRQPEMMSEDAKFALGY
jgi:hypothetical protein